MTGGAGPSRRSVLGASFAAALAPLGCTRSEAPRFEGGWVGASHERGHLVRAGSGAAAPGGAASAGTRIDVSRRVGAIVVGGGVAGLAAARALREAGIDDSHVLELEDGAGGNSRGHTMAGMRCPLGAHYLPVPGEGAVEVVRLLEELGVRKLVGGRAVYDERVLCHSPQERLFIA
ncbi:MAG: NAD(P)-binding protein, partial [Caldimonas sp.]